jgi:hypothetical protein
MGKSRIKLEIKSPVTKEEPELSAKPLNAIINNL